jgi:hypothetical protein
MLIDLTIWTGNWNALFCASWQEWYDFADDQGK